MGSVTETEPNLRELFGEALELWRKATNAAEYDNIWPVLDQAAGFARGALDVSLYFLKTDDVARRAVSADLLGRLALTGDEFHDAIGAGLTERLEIEDDVDVIWSILTALVPVRAVSAVPKLLEYASSTMAPFRLQAVRALGRLLSAMPEDASLTSTIVNGMEDTDGLVRAEATSVAATQLPLENAEVSDALGKRLFDPEDPPRLLAIHGLALRRDPRALDAIRYSLERDVVPARVFASAMVLADPTLIPNLEAANHSNLDDARFEAVLEACRNGTPVRPPA